MIHDAKVEVTCDNMRCTESVIVDLHFVYSGIMHSVGHYDHNDKVIEKDLINQHGWIVPETGKHFCSEECAHRKDDENEE